MEREDLANAFTKDANGKLFLDKALIESWVDIALKGFTKLNAGIQAPAMLRPIDDQEVEDRLFLAMLNEGARCMAEGIVPEPGYLDLAMIYGTGFPPYRGGLLREADTRGVAACVARAEALAVKAPWLKPSDGLKSAASKNAFYA